MKPIQHLALSAVIAIGVAIGLFACGSSDAGKPHDDHRGHDHAAGGTDDHAEPVAAGPSQRIAIPVSVRENLGITFTKAQSRVVEGVLRVPGRFEADAGARQEYPMPLTGAITVLVRPYDPVAVGAPLYRVAGQAWAQLRAQWHEAHSAAEQGDESAKRRRDLLAGTLSQMLGRSIETAQGHTLCDAAELTVHARAAGIVEPELVASGRVLEAHAAVLSVTDPTRIRLRAIALQADLAMFEVGRSARIVPVASSHSESFPASFRLALEADAAHRTVDVIAWLDGDQRPFWARPGVAAQLEVAVAGGDEELAIPVAATIRDGLSTVIFRRDPAQPDTVLRIDGDLGVSDGVWVQVLSGLKEGDEVVTGGIYPLKLGSQGGAAPKGAHVHPDGTVHEGSH
ncbi:MAG: efflux RND transporter periplasmic adaptor subunit [Planctomycetes bacterium]|nr:efflux RND transporter periplasmic adaptor subunit [Planctomycetota bacterium]